MYMKAVIDRFEESKAVLLINDEEQQVNWPTCLLPPEAAEGDYLDINLSVNAELTAAARREAEELLRTLHEE